MTETNSDQNSSSDAPGKPKYSMSWPVIFLAIFLVIGTAVYIKNTLLPGVLRQSNLNSDSISKKENIFSDNFEKNTEIQETGKMSESSSLDWWVNSGGIMKAGSGTAQTIQGDLQDDSIWYEKYKKNNPKDTDGGRHPQNIFRLINRGKWDNLRQEAYFRINKINYSGSENRNQSNGILLMSRYEDGDNLYYTGLRVDGSAIIKKKYAGEYYTLSEEKFLPGDKYDRDDNPNLLPLGEWIGLRCELENTPAGDLEIKLFVDEGRTGDWKLAASVLDNGKKEFGKNIISDEGHAGIRTDFMDVEFSDYKISEL
jgi:hypothetical protein